MQTAYDAWIDYYTREVKKAVDRMNEALQQDDMKQWNFQENVADWHCNKIKELERRKLLSASTYAAS